MNCEGPRLGLKAIKTLRTNGTTTSFSVDMKYLLLQHVNMSQGLEMQILLPCSRDSISNLTLITLF